MTERAWQAAYAARFHRVAIRRPTRESMRARGIYVRPTDAEIAAMPERVQGIALATRSLHDVFSAVTPQPWAVKS